MAFAAKAQDWECLPIAPPNDFVYGLNVYKGTLIISGGFNTKGPLKANGIMAWSDTSFSTLQGGLRRIQHNFSAQVGQTLSYKDSLYVTGVFDSAGHVAAKDIAMWSGSQWKAMGKGAHGNINCVAAYRNEIYAAGNFDSIDGIAANNIARWDGSQWHALGLGIAARSVNCLYVYKDELYASGAIDSVGGIPSLGIGRWNGTQWRKVSDHITEGNCMVEWKGTLLIGPQEIMINFDFYAQIMQWDGSDCVLFSQQQLPGINDLEVYNGNLYCGWGIVRSDSNFSCVSKYDTLKRLWLPIGKGLNYSAGELCVFNNQLYAGGAFNRRDSAKCDFVARLNNNIPNTAIASIHKEKTLVTLNADRDEIIVNTTIKQGTIAIYNIEGQLIMQQPIKENISAIAFNEKGLFIWRILAVESGSAMATGKILNY